MEYSPKVEAGEVAVHGHFDKPVDGVYNIIVEINGT
jgi:hypothetical protein